LPFTPAESSMPQLPGATWKQKIRVPSLVGGAGSTGMPVRIES